MENQTQQTRFKPIEALIEERHNQGFRTVMNDLMQAGLDNTIPITSTAHSLPDIRKYRSLIRPEGLDIQYLLTKDERFGICLRDLFDPSLVDENNRVVNLPKRIQNPELREYAISRARHLSLQVSPIRLGELAVCVPKLINHPPEQSELIRVIYYISERSSAIFDSPDKLNDTITPQAALALLCMLEVYGDITRPTSRNYVPHRTALARLIPTAVKLLGPRHPLAVILTSPS